MNGGEAIIRALEDEGNDYIFGIPGIHNLPIFDAINDSNITAIINKHEQGSGFMADGYARIKRTSPGVEVLAAGPGALNAISATSTSYLDSIPLLILAGGVGTNVSGKGGAHDIDQVASFASVTKLSRKIRGSNTYLEIRDAFNLANQPRQRPVFIEIPFDLQLKTVPVARYNRSYSSNIPNSSAISEIIKEIENNDKIVVIAGGGVISSFAEGELREFSTFLNIPVATTINGMGAIPNESPRSIGISFLDSSASSIEKADLVIALGCRFSERTTRDWGLKLKKLIQVDIDTQEFGKNYQPDIAIQANIKDFLGLLLQGIKAKGGNLRKSRWWKSAFSEERPPRISHDSTFIHQTIAEIIKSIGTNAILSVDTGYAFWGTIGTYKCALPRRYICSAGNGGMGYALPASIGAKLAKPELSSIALVGDGSFMMSGAELSVAVNNNIDVTVVIFNDSGFGSIRDYQRKAYGERLIGTTFKTIDFKKLSEGLGVSYSKIEKVNEISEMLNEAIDKGGITLLEIKIDSHEYVGVPDFLISSYGKHVEK